MGFNWGESELLLEWKHFYSKLATGSKIGFAKMQQMKQIEERI